jgi:hypothetical protein
MLLRFFRLRPQVGGLFRCPQPRRIHWALNIEHVSFFIEGSNGTLTQRDEHEP